MDNRDAITFAPNRAKHSTYVPIIKIYVHSLDATMLHLFGLDYERLAFRTKLDVTSN